MIDLPRRGAEPGVAQLIRSAAHAAECPFAAFYTAGDSVFALVCSFGVKDPAAVDLDQWILAEAWTQSAESAFVASDIRHQPGLGEQDVHLFGTETGPVRFLAAIRVTPGHGMPQGLLVVGDTHPHAGLSAATIFVLRTHAAQLAVVQELQALRNASSEAGVGADSDTVAERLRLLEAVVVNASDAVLITQAEPIQWPGPQIVSCNVAFTRMTGYAEDEAIGQTPRMLQSSKTDRKTLDRLRNALERWEPVEVELLNRRKDGTDFWVELSIVPVANEMGHFTHWISVQRDVTARKIARDTGFRAGAAESLILQAEIRERRIAESKLLYAAFHDDLTKLRNRAYFMDRLGIALGHANDGRGMRCAMLFMDLDGFKLVNDSLGHRAGDLLLMQVAQRLRACVRPSDTLARLGGDEFALIIESTGERAPAVTLARRIIESLRSPIWLGKQEVFCSCSIGISVASEEYDSAVDMLRDAEIAMYKTKETKPGSFTVFGAAMHDTAIAALELQTDLRNAVARDEFFLQYQPICQAATREIIGVEALIRWNHPQRGIVQPGEFIATAEESGLIRDIGRWVLRQACLQLREWRDKMPDRHLRITVNVSGKELRYDDFVAETLGIVQASGLEPTALQLEVTESVFLTDPEAIGKILNRLREAGIRIALDDFGTGYSSLGFIDRYPMDTIKIDRTFVNRMLARRRTMAIVRSIAQLGHDLSLDIIAEGVETEEQLRALQDTGCDFVQGYLLSRPVSVEDMEAMLLSGRPV